MYKFIKTSYIHGRYTKSKQNLHVPNPNITSEPKVGHMLHELDTKLKEALINASKFTYN